MVLLSPSVEDEEPDTELDEDEEEADEELDEEEELGNGDIIIASKILKLAGNLSALSEVVMRFALHRLQLKTVRLI